MSKLGARIQLAGVLLFALSTWLPCFHLRTYPGLERLPPGSYVMPEARVEVPAVELWGGLISLAEGNGAASLWAARRWYPLALAPLWLLTLLWAGRIRAVERPRRRRVAGAVLLAASLAVAVFEWIYLRSDYVGFLGPGLGTLEVLLAYAVVLAVLFLRRPGAYRISMLEATVAAQALLALVHAATLPCTDVRPWWDRHDLASLCRALAENYLPAFWIGCLGLLLAALPAYALRARVQPPSASTAPVPRPPDPHPR